MSEWYIGLMSGTSLDGVDAVLADFGGMRTQVLAHGSLPLPDSLKAELLALNQAGDNEIHRAALAGNALARLYAQAVQEVLLRAGATAAQVRAVGAHGQTVRHRPQAFDGTGYTVQLNAPALLAELCGIDVVADFRSRDVAAGGQGAPLVPPFHQAFFPDASQTRAVLNIGGIANLTVLRPAQAHVQGFDCGPGNMLIDAWCQAHTGAPFDADGRWAASGTVHEPLLAHLLREPFFALPVPKSTGRDLFNSAWLQHHLAPHPGLPPQDVQATLTALTAHSAAQAVHDYAADAQQLIVCGGGACNGHLMGMLQRALPDCEVLDSAALGLPPLQVEATAFAWLARQTIRREPGSLPSATGARGARVLGGIYLA